MKGMSDGFLGQLFRSRGQMDTQCVAGVRALVSLMLEDEEIARYVFN